MRELGQLYTARLSAHFGNDEGRYDHEIDVLTQNIMKACRARRSRVAVSVTRREQQRQNFKTAEERLKNIATAGSAKGLSGAERTVRLNVMRRLGSELQSMSKDFRRSEKDFLSRENAPRAAPPRLSALSP